MRNKTKYRHKNRDVYVVPLSFIDRNKGKLRSGYYITNDHKAWSKHGGFQACDVAASAMHFRFRWQAQWFVRRGVADVS